MLFTVTATFSDFTAAYEQYDATGPAEALASFFRNAESLSEHDPRSIATAADSEGHRIMQVAGETRGLWMWHLIERLEQYDVALYGGCIVQTDPAGLVRPNGPS